MPHKFHNPMNQHLKKVAKLFYNSKAIFIITKMKFKFSGTKYPMVIRVLVLVRTILTLASYGIPKPSTNDPCIKISPSQQAYGYENSTFTL